MACGKPVGVEDATILSTAGHFDRLSLCRTHRKSIARMLVNTGHAEAAYVPISDLLTRRQRAA